MRVILTNNCNLSRTSALVYRKPHYRLRPDDGPWNVLTYWFDYEMFRHQRPGTGHRCRHDVSSCHLRHTHVITRQYHVNVYVHVRRWRSLLHH